VLSNWGHDGALTKKNFFNGSKPRSWQNESGMGIPTTDDPAVKLVRATRRVQKALQEIAEATGQSYDEVLVELTPDILQLLKQWP
jgi:hypothetical protein